MVLASPWNLILTLTFGITGAICIGDLLIGRRRAFAGPSRRDELLVDVNHAVMSAGMILMTWVVVPDVATWTQVAVFAIFALALVMALRTSPQVAVHRIDLVGHLVMNGAMIWMLAAMPLLMGDMHRHGEHGGHHDLLTSTPVWADAVNAAFVTLSAAGGLWWLYRLLVAPGHRVHLLCHVLMAAGMAIMLVMMNA